VKRFALFVATGFGLGLVADARELVVFAGHRRRHDDFGRRSTPRRERFLYGIAPVNPFTTGHEFSRAPVVTVVVVIAHYLAVGAGVAGAAGAAGAAGTSGVGAGVVAASVGSNGAASAAGSASRAIIEREF